ncbi:hypothetical protein F4695_002297 [Rhizobium soli]|uniref:Polysaccharide deacetylase n=1 Tax=Rhizobium soli TaxID=424798 RepID=A0A7X0MT74_9HYPH|nr:polysaccharide deacetylase family protein [Rhizobium soli]MBB6508940.1 hypothetical protein [Rhizobium soli]
MTENDLRLALDRLADNGRRVDFWLRDDDAVEPTEQLAKLATMTDAFSVPATLAVIPEKTGADLASYLDTQPHLDVAVHGWSHRSYAGAGEKKQELGSHRPLPDMVSELKRGFDKLAALHASRFVPMLVPPWNRIAPELIEALPGLGFKALSTFGPEQAAPVAMLNSHVDIMDWHGTRGGRPAADLIAETIALIEAPDRAPVIGVLGHHLVHDDSAWHFLDMLFGVTADHPVCRWRSARDLLKL